MATKICRNTLRLIYRGYEEKYSFVTPKKKQNGGNNKRVLLAWFKFVPLSGIHTFFFGTHRNSHSKQKVGPNPSK